MWEEDSFLRLNLTTLAGTVGGGWSPRYRAVKRERGPARVPRLLGEDEAPFDLEP